MKKLKHTPAPWYAVNYGGYITIQSTNFYENTNILDEDKCERAEDNGLLCAAAPDLLEALKECLEGVHELNDEFQTGWDEVIEKAEAAINKALGIKEQK